MASGCLKYPGVLTGPLTRTSPSSARRTSTPAMAGPTVPILTLPGRLPVATPVVSVMPYTSTRGRPRAAKNSATSTASGEAALEAKVHRSSPIPCLTLASTSRSSTACRARSPNGTGSPRWVRRTTSRPVSTARWAILRLRSFSSAASLAVMPARTFSHTLGTPKNSVGRASRTYSTAWVGSGQNQMWVRMVSGP